MDTSGYVHNIIPGMHVAKYRRGGYFQRQHTSERVDRECAQHIDSIHDLKVAVGLPSAIALLTTGITYKQ